MLDIKITRTTCPKEKPQDESKLGFGKKFTDHMFVMDYTEGEGWHDARIVPYAPFPLDPATVVFHYAQEIFEGMKAYRTAAVHRALFHLAVFQIIHQYTQEADVHQKDQSHFLRNSRRRFHTVHLVQVLPEDNSSAEDPRSLHDPNASVPRMDDMDNTDRTYDMLHYNKKNHLDHSSSQLAVSSETLVSSVV